jgi:cytochrome c oxidase subunit 2
MTPTKEGTYAIVCNEYCGIGHHSMLGRIYVK